MEGDASFYITDDETSWSGATYGVYSLSHVIEPGYMKIVIENDWTSYDEASCTITITVTETTPPVPDITISGTIRHDEWIGWIPITVPEGTTEAVIELWWVNDWSEYPTSDLDLYIYWDEGYNYNGATLNAPERVVLAEPTILYVLLHGYTVYEEVEPEPYELRIYFTP